MTVSASLRIVLGTGLELPLLSNRNHQGSGHTSDPMIESRIFPDVTEIQNPYVLLALNTYAS